MPQGLVVIIIIIIIIIITWPSPLGVAATHMKRAGCVTSSPLVCNQLSWQRDQLPYAFPALQVPALSPRQLQLMAKASITKQKEEEEYVIGKTSAGVAGARAKVSIIITSTITIIVTWCLLTGQGKTPR
ncbi:hypothetical protein, partial [Flavobacterium sp.]|uniref:hypothetical protein n=1 Tax=Flavobacterium sp. TaxID=239 RepID=UPI004033FF36